MARINKTLGINLRADYVTRLRSIGFDRKQIEKLDFYLDVAIDSVNESAKDLLT